MLDPQRNKLYYGGFLLESLTNDLFPLDFDCSDPDLNEFFLKDAFVHDAELYTKTYALRSCNIDTGEKSLTVAALISYCNDAVLLKDFKKHADELPEEKQYPSIPAVKIARLGVQKNLQRNGVGSLLLNLTKVLFVTNNRTGCRLITVDAYNHPQVIGFYSQGGFDFIRDKDAAKRTRIMFYDLTRTPQDEIQAFASGIQIV
jgi:GNAT superfamily N-acetyltransferase